MSNIKMTNILTLNIFTVLKVCWMTVLAATIVTIKPQVVVSFVLKEVAIVHENAHLMRNYALLVALFLTLIVVLANLAVGGQMKLSVRNEQSKVRNVN